MRYIPEDGNINIYGCENLKSYKTEIFFSSGGKPVHPSLVLKHPALSSYSANTY
jgi:hypothetical protein